jgi:hypothetical protein
VCVSPRIIWHAMEHSFLIEQTVAWRNRQPIQEVTGGASNLTMWCHHAFDV